MGVFLSPWFMVVMPFVPSFVFLSAFILLVCFFHLALFCGKERVRTMCFICMGLVTLLCQSSLSALYDVDVLSDLFVALRKLGRI